MNDQNNDIEILKMVEKFGFKFFGYDENKATLVVAPNGQIVTLSVAYEFVQSQIAKSQSGNGGIEGMPSMPNILEGNFESNLEKEIEVEKALEKKQENTAQQNNNQQTSAQPQVATKPVEPESPYGDGFKPLINPVYIEKAIEYIKKNSNGYLCNLRNLLTNKKLLK
jgi:hypothetical protein